MNKAKSKPILLLPLSLILALPASGTVLFQDTFDRANGNDIDASTTGMSGTAGSVIYVETDPGVAPTGTLPDPEVLTNITGNTLHLAEGTNASAIGIDGHNFTDAIITTTGNTGFSVSLDIGGLLAGGAINDTNFYVGFGVGMTQAEIQGISLDLQASNGPRGTFGLAQNGVADFYVGWTPNGGGDLQFFKRATSGGTVFDLNVSSPAFATLRADFTFTDFNAGTNVDVDVYWGDTFQFSETFQWNGTNQNYLAISGRNNAGLVVDNFVVQTIPEPGTTLLLGLGLLGLVRRRR